MSTPTLRQALSGEKHHHSGTVTFSHQMPDAMLAHPDRKEVIPLIPESILKQDGAKKNDYERNAAKRLLRDLRHEHPHLKLIVSEDALAAMKTKSQKPLLAPAS